MSDFEPTVIAFVCNWCTYTAADLAGTSRRSYPKNVRLIRVMCTGMVDPQYIIKAFLEGADGVLVSGCHPGDCHYINGNCKARRRIKLLKEILPQFGGFLVNESFPVLLYLTIRVASVAVYILPLVVSRAAAAPPAL